MIFEDHCFSTLDALSFLCLPPTASNAWRRLLRLWVPAGEKQWQDGWHPRRSTWDVHPELAHTMKGSNADGTFWLTWNDFCHYFHTLEICAKEDS